MKVEVKSWAIFEVKLNKRIKDEKRIKKLGIKENGILE